MPPANLSLPESRSGAGPSSDQTSPSERAKVSVSFDSVWRPIPGYEVRHMIRKSQVRWIAKGDVIAQVLFIKATFGLKAA
jgi:hypothetical protein